MSDDAPKRPVQVWLDERSLETLELLKKYYGANKSDALRAGLENMRKFMKDHEIS